jgi:hypothetical protein
MKSDSSAYRRATERGRGGRGEGGGRESESGRGWGKRHAVPVNYEEFTGCLSCPHPASRALLDALPFPPLLHLLPFTLAGTHPRSSASRHRIAPARRESCRCTFSRNARGFGGEGGYSRARSGPPHPPPVNKRWLSRNVVAPGAYHSACNILITNN